MTSLQDKLKRIRDALAGIESLTVFHYFHYREELPYCIWAEDGEGGNVQTDNKKTEQAITGTTDYFTKTEFDPMVDKIQEAFNNVEGLFYRLNDVDRDDEEGCIHYEWTWRIV